MFINNIELWQGDCLELMKKIPDKSIDLVLCDPPYGITACKWDCNISFDQLWNQYKRIIKDNACIVLFGQEPFSSLLRTSNLEMYRYDWVWQKQKPSNFQLMNYQPGRVQENIMVFSKAKACYTKNGVKINYFPIKEKRETPRKANVKIYGSNNLLHTYKTANNYKLYEDKMPISILQFSTPAKKLHPTEKPMSLLEYLIKTYTKENNIVLDNYMGGWQYRCSCQKAQPPFHRYRIGRALFQHSQRKNREYTSRR